MTISAAVQAEITPYTAEQSVIDKACIDEGVSSEDTYSVDMALDVAKVAIRLLRKFIVMASESEGGYQVAYDVKALRVRIADIAAEHGLQENVSGFSKPQINDKSSYW